MGFTISYIKCNVRNSFTVCLKEDAKIFVINSLEDLKNSPLNNEHGEKVLDFERISKKYDAIWLTEKGLNQTHYAYPLDLYGWDCETVLILNNDCFTTIS